MDVMLKQRIRFELEYLRACELSLLGTYGRKSTDDAPNSSLARFIFENNPYCSWLSTVTDRDASPLLNISFASIVEWYAYGEAIETEQSLPELLLRLARGSIVLQRLTSSILLRTSRKIKGKQSHSLGSIGMIATMTTIAMLKHVCRHVWSSNSIEMLLLQANADCQR